MRQPRRARTRLSRCRCAPKSVTACWMGQMYFTCAAWLQGAGRGGGPSTGPGARHQQGTSVGGAGAVIGQQGRSAVLVPHLRNVTSGGSASYGGCCVAISTLRGAQARGGVKPGVVERAGPALRCRAASAQAAAEAQAALHPPYRYTFNIWGLTRFRRGQTAGRAPPSAGTRPTAGSAPPPAAPRAPLRPRGAPVGRASAGQRLACLAGGGRQGTAAR